MFYKDYQGIQFIYPLFLGSPRQVNDQCGGQLNIIAQTLTSPTTGEGGCSNPSHSRSREILS